jgi:hypothetical protein
VTHRIFAPIGALAILAFAPAAAARAPKPYVRKRPAREHCKRHYVRAIKRVKVRRHGKRVRVRQVWCVYKGSITLLRNRSDPPRHRRRALSRRTRS